MPTYLTPGVYIEEVSTGPRPIEAVGTSTAGFVGIAPNADAHVNEAVAVNNWTQFVKEFVGDKTESTNLARAVFGYFQNGGSRCYIANVGASGSIAGGGTSRQGIDVLAPIDEVAIVVAPGFTDAASYDAVLTHCETLKDRVAILDAPETSPSIEALTIQATAAVTRRSARRAAGGDDTADSSATLGGDGSAGLRPRSSDGGYGAVYYPWIVASDPLAPKERVSTPPSGHIAGIYARTDAMRGVHKAPANETIRGALDVTYKVTRDEQGQLNSKGVNCIRSFPAQGIRVWGARTLADSASEWRYINVRRLFNMIEEAIALGTRWVVFEPNDASLWQSIRRDVSAFLTLIWRQGALMGATPEQAFFCQCDAETNPPEMIDSGTVVTLIGIAPVKPAEFVVFRIGQGAGGAEIVTEGGR